MANTRGTVTGGNANSDTGTASRLGSRYITATADTWQTFARVTTWADGRVVVEIRNDAGELMAGLTLARELESGETGRRALSIRTVPEHVYTLADTEEL